MTETQPAHDIVHNSDETADTVEQDNAFGGSLDQFKEWQKLSPLSTLYFVAKWMYKFLSQGIQGMLPLLAVVVTAGDKRWMIIGAFILSAVVFLSVAAFLTYLKFRFRILDTEVQIESGVLSRKQLHLDFDRIQNIALEEPLYFRPFGLVSVKVESAGSSSEEVSLGGIKRSDAELIRSIILDNAAAVQAEQVQLEDVDESVTQSEPKVKRLLSLPISELVRYGVSNNNIWVMAGLVAGIMPQMEPWEWGIFEQVEAFGEEQFGHIVYGFQLFIAAIAFVVFLLMIGLSILGAIISQFNFTLTRGDDKRFHLSKGLFERKETSMPEQKIQSVLIRQGWVAKLVDRWHIYLKQVSFGYNNAKKQARGGDSLLIPSATDDFAAKIQSIIFSDFNRSDNFTGISARYIFKQIGFVYLPIGALFAGFIFYHKGEFESLFPLLLPVLMAPIIYLRWRRFGVQTDGKHGYVRSGLLGVQYRLFAFYKVQGVEVVQSYGMRKTRHANLRIRLAGNRVEIPYLPLDVAEKWRDLILYEIETTDKNFM